jgi:CDP-diacylglycerol--glycerol-3-phosphate 3-phosphatidyltransferase
MGDTVDRTRPVWVDTAVATATVAALLTGVVATRGAVGAPFLVAVGSALVVETAVFRRANGQVSESGPQPFTLPTLVTAVRGAAVAVLAGFAVAGRPAALLAWLPALLFAGEALLDAVDGALARATDTTTAFGSHLDTETDALALLVGSAAAVRFGAAPAFYVAVGLARYGFVAGLALRRYRGSPVSDLPARESRRLLAAAQMLVLAVVLVPVLDTTLSRLLATAGMVPFLLGFLRDWLLVTRRRFSYCWL